MGCCIKFSHPANHARSGDFLLCFISPLSQSLAHYTGMPPLQSKEARFKTSKTAASVLYFFLYTALVSLTLLVSVLESTTPPPIQNAPKVTFSAQPGPTKPKTIPEPSRPQPVNLKYLQEKLITAFWQWVSFVRRGGAAPAFAATCFCSGFNGPKSACEKNNCRVFNYRPSIFHWTTAQKPKSTKTQEGFSSIFWLFLFYLSNFSSCFFDAKFTLTWIMMTTSLYLLAMVRYAIQLLDYCTGHVRKKPSANQTNDSSLFQSPCCLH